MKVKANENIPFRLVAPPCSAPTHFEVRPAEPGQVQVLMTVIAELPRALCPPGGAAANARRNVRKRR